MALASIFTGWNQTGSTLSETAGDPGRYGRVPYADMLASTSSVRIFAGAGAPALILFNHNPSLDFEHFLDPEWKASMLSFHGEFIQFTNGGKNPWDLNLNENVFGLDVSLWNNAATSMLVVRTEDAPEQRLSFRSIILQPWRDFFDTELPNEAQRVGDPVIHWHAFTSYGAGSDGWLNPDRIYIYMRQNLSVDPGGDWWWAYDVTVRYWIGLRADGNGGVVAWVRRYEWWVESGVLTDLVAAIVEPNVELGAIEIENRLNAGLAALQGVTDVYLLPGTQSGQVGGAHGAWWSDTRGDVTLVIQR